MGESLWLHERCLALQLVRNDLPPSRPPKESHPSRNRPHQKGFSKLINPNPTSEPIKTSSTNPPAATTTSPSSDSDTPTPTNGGVPPLPVSYNSNGSPSSTPTHINKYQDGYLLFQAWQAANTVCVWNKDLMFAVREAMYVGLLVGGILLVGGSSEVLATITHAWSRSLLVAPTGFSLAMLGEVSGCKMIAVPQGHFTPLADALCWVIHRLTEGGGTADTETLHSTLNASFPSLTTPDSTIIHATLSSLIHQRKVFHSGKSYGIVHPETYQLTSVMPATASPCSAEYLPENHHESSHSVLDTTNHNSTLGGAQLVVKDGRCHAKVQTNLAELITGATLPTDKILIPTKQCSSKALHPSLERQTSLGMLSGRRHHSRTASLRLSPTKVAKLAQTFGDTPISKSICNTNVYEANDMSDITVKAERGSMLTKLLRVSPRRRLASFSAQFPPQEWTDPNASAVHLHSVAVQTSSRQRKNSSDILWTSTPSWTPRSSTLPRRLRRPLSCTPPLSQNSNPESSSLLEASSHHVLGPETFNSSPQSLVHASPHGTLMQQPHSSCKGSLDRLLSEPSHYFLNDNVIIPETYKYISRSEHDVDRQCLSLNNSGSIEYGVCRLSGRMINRKHTSKENSQHSSPEHHTSGMKPHTRTSKKPPYPQSRRSEEILTKRKGEIHPRKIGETIKGKELTHVSKQKLLTSTKEKCHKLHESCYKHKVSERDKENDKVSEKDKENDQIQEKKNVQVSDCDETPVRDLPNFSTSDKSSHGTGSKVSRNIETNEKGKIHESPKPQKKEMADNCIEEKNISDTPSGTSYQDEDNKKYNRSSLQLDLTSPHMNNSKKIVSSPHRPEGLKNNMLHDGKGMNHISKGSSHDVNNRNLGYRDIDKCHKQSCSQTLDEAQQVSEPTLKVLTTPEFEGHTHNQVSKDESSKRKPKTHRSPKKKLVSSLPKDPNIMEEDTSKMTSKAIDNVSPDDSNVNAKNDSTEADVASINTYPSLSELNLNFSSLAAQKILHGVSHNSIDTLVEVNLAAEKRKISVKRPEAVTNTDFGFL